jgi:hypothetical protein
MKPEYIEMVLSHLEGIENSNKVIQEMLEGKRPSNQRDAISLTKKIDKLLELSRNLIK